MVTKVFLSGASFKNKQIWSVLTPTLHGDFFLKTELNTLKFLYAEKWTEGYYGVFDVLCI